MRQVSDLKPTHRATLFPSLAYTDIRRGACRALIHGRVFDTQKIPLGTRFLLRGLKKAMQLDDQLLLSEIFRERIDGFLGAPGKRRRIVLQIGEHRFRLRRRSRKDGTFFGTLAIPSDLIAPFHPRPCELTSQLIRPGDEATSGAQDHVVGAIHYVPPQGVSVISDIDDTIKLTDATNRKALLANTFLHPFEPIEGMSEVYSRWAAVGCSFHYVSSSPWQLFHPLAALCRQHGFPAGSMHLRYFRVRDEMLKRFRPLRHNSKVGIMVHLMRRLPMRRFILVGDSGERDPEIYWFLAKKFPTKVAAICIRNLPQRPLAGRRAGRLRDLASMVPVHVFDSARQIEGIAERLMGN
ncbi:MAG: hypothetical protein KatS3mg111_1955 [Pirellulaceae bacterium]|nr:MAG: hypothetical protein KatS3mg111_1955 [Pirellulaceae bacterium]